MIPYEQAVATIGDTLAALPAESVTLDQADGRVLATDVRSALDLPRFDQSAMDGIAVHAADLAGARTATPVALSLKGEMPAGTGSRPRLRPGTAVKVFTGSMLPRGADAVVMKEDCVFGDGRVVVGREPRPGDHIRTKGEELRRGDPLLTAGTRLTPAAVGLLASNGIESVRAYARPTVALITMGDELLLPGERLTPGKIRDANGPALAAALVRAGVAKVRRRHVKDDPAALRRILARSIRDSDLVVTVGGASVGDHDHVAGARAALGVRDLFDRVAVKPGKPNVYGHAPDGTPLFGLPGNPVSALVSFRLFVVPAVRILQGLRPDSDWGLRAVLERDVAKKAGRLEWVRGTVTNVGGELAVAPTTGQGSHMLSGLAAADVLIEFPAGVEKLPAGTSVRIRPLGW